MSLQWSNINFAASVARLANTKNGTPRDVPLSSRAAATLTSLPRSLDGRVFPLATETVKDSFRRIADSAELQDLRFHDLRHEATSRFFEKGLDTMEVAAITGHKTLTMLRRYTHLRAADLARKLG
ncbi:MAG: site-specific integrase [Proteobacteria bacterium]|nr:site-specific integrase [Pseudomonadota bacterium]